MLNKISHGKVVSEHVEACFELVDNDCYPLGRWYRWRHTLEEVEPPAVLEGPPNRGNEFLSHYSRLRGLRRCKCPIGDLCTCSASKHG